jgi:hypothetical protein
MQPTTRARKCISCTPGPNSITESFIESYERVLIISWLLKDFGWMMTDVYLALPFGILSVTLHFILVFIEPRISYRWYDISLLCWVTGNFLWMCTEFMYSHNNREVHMGPETPIGDWPAEWEDDITLYKMILFLIGVCIQLIMYVLLYTGSILMPVDYGEDVIALNEVQLLCGSRRRANCHQSTAVPSSGTPYYTTDDRNAHGGLASLADIYDDGDTFVSDDTAMSDRAAAISQPRGYQGYFAVVDNRNDSSYFTVAYVENIYILFWILKDLFWCWGTGDLLGVAPSEPLIALCEALAISFGSVAILNNILTAYIWRRDPILFLDCLSAVCWIAANFTWMCGEFFVRYDNLELADDDQGDDYKTRIIATCFFLIGISIQIYNVVILIRQKITVHNRNGAQQETRRRQQGGLYASPFEMVAFAPVAHSPQRNGYDDDEESELVVF